MSTSTSSSSPLPSTAKTPSPPPATPSPPPATPSPPPSNDPSAKKPAEPDTAKPGTSTGMKIFYAFLVILVIGILAWLFGWGSGVYDYSKGDTNPCNNTYPDGYCSSGTCAKDGFGNSGCFPSCATAGNCAAGLDCYNKVCTVGPCGVTYPNGTCANGQVCIPLNIEGTSFKCGTACSSSTLCSPTGTICSTAATGNNKGCIFPASSLTAPVVVTPQVRKYSSFDMVGSYDNYVTFVPNTQSQFMGVSERVNLPFYTSIREPVNLTINVSVQSVDPAAETWLYYGTNRVYKIPSQPGNYGPIRYSTADLNKAFVVMSDKKTRITGAINFTGS